MIVRDMDARQVCQTLARLLQGSGPVRCVSDHRRIQAGDVWFAMPGLRFDPRTELEAALGAGIAAAVLEADHFPESLLPLAETSRTPVYLLSELGRQAGEMAATLVAQDSPMPRLIAVTGTNGKTSVTRWVAQSLSYLNDACAVVGTLGYGFIDGEFEYTGLTTPDAVSLQNALASLGRAGARSVALEASSIGLDQGRLQGCRFSVAAFTNLSRDHLDYHGDMAAYEKAKQRLFAWSGLNRAVINLDDPAAERFMNVAQQAGVPVIAVTANQAAVPAGANDALCVRGQHAVDGSHIEILHRNQSASVFVPVVGQFNLENIAVVAGILLASGYGVSDIAAALSAVTPPPGRMQMLSQPDSPLVVIDYAHTPDALEKALSALRPVATARGGHLACVFGCGGDRDPGKRPLMGAIAERLADSVVVTSDNPRSESPEAIIAEIAAGFSGAHTARCIPDRAQAILQTIMGATPADVVLLAGKGHEEGQIIGDAVLPFSDVEQAGRALSQRSPLGQGSA